MRIAFASDGIFPYAVGGMQRHTAFLAEALVAAGAHVTVFAPEGHGQGSHSFTVRPIPWPDAGSYPARLWRYAGRCSEAIAASQYDVVYGQGLTLLGRLPDKAAPSLFNPHGLELCTVPGALPRLKAWPLRIGARRQARQATRTVSLGGRLTSTLVTCLGVQPERIVVIPNGVDASYFVDGGEPRDSRLVLFVGRLFPNKGADVLCRAVAQLPADVNVVIAGEGPLRDSLRKAYPDPRIVFRGEIDEDELHSLYRRAAVLALPTRSEGMPTVILEAFACGTPAVATDVGAVAELVDDSTGVLIPAPDHDLLANALRHVLQLSDSERAALGEAARRRVHDRFTWDAVAAKTLTTLEEIVR